MKTLYVGNDKTVMLTCPACDKSRVVDVSRYLITDGPVRFTYRFQCDNCRCGHNNCQECVRENCSLGHVNTVRLERRQSVRREMSVSGLFTTSENENVRVRILDIARKTVRVEFSAAVLAENAGKGVLEFRLDDRNQTQVRKAVKLERCDGNVVVFQFKEEHAYSSADKAIGFYLMNTEDMKS